jgi:hypothetical protein
VMIGERAFLLGIGIGIPGRENRRRRLLEVIIYAINFSSVYSMMRCGSGRDGDLARPSRSMISMTGIILINEKYRNSFQR